MGRSSMSKAIRRHRTSPRVSPRRRCTWTRASARRSASRSIRGSRRRPWASRRGVLLLIDYGYPAAELYDSGRRRDGTLRAYLRHRVHDDPYRHVGRQDLTAHVDISAVERAASVPGSSTWGPRPRPNSSSGSGPASYSSGSRTIPRPRWRTTSRFGPRSCGCSTRARWVGSGSWASRAAGPSTHRSSVSATVSRDRRRPRRTGHQSGHDHTFPHWTSRLGRFTYCRAYGGAARFRWSGTT